MKAESILKETKARWLTKCQCQLTDHPGKKKRLTPARPPKLTKRTGDFPVLYHCFPGLISTWTPKNVLLQWGGEHFHRILDSYPISSTAWKHQRLGPNFSGLIGLFTNGFLKPIGWILQVEEGVLLETADVSSLYTIIPYAKAVDHFWNLDHSISPVQKQFVLQFSMEPNYFLLWK